MMMRTVLLGDLEKELHRIRRYIDKEENPIRKAKMLDRCRKVYRALNQKQLYKEEFHASNVCERNQSATSKKMRETWKTGPQKGKTDFRFPRTVLPAAVDSD